MADTPNLYYRIEVKDLCHGIKRWARVTGYVSFDKDRLGRELQYFRAAAKLRGNTEGNQYRLVQVNKRTKKEMVIK